MAMIIDCIERRLVKALMALPAPDFNLCMFLVPKRLQVEEPFLTLATLLHFSETARFREFWDEANRSRDTDKLASGQHLLFESKCYVLTHSTLPF
ncbi:unnamed protein product [Calypogeia fissa]